MPSSAGARAAVGVEADHDLSLDIPRSLTLHEDEALSLDHGGHNEEEEERLQAQREMQMVCIPFNFHLPPLRSCDSPLLRLSSSFRRSAFPG